MSHKDKTRQRDEARREVFALRARVAELESERDAARAEVERLTRREATVQALYESASTSLREEGADNERLRGLLDENEAEAHRLIRWRREALRGSLSHSHEDGRCALCDKARAALAGSPVEARREKAEAWLNQGPEVSGTLAFHTEPVETRRALAERVRSHLIDYLYRSGYSFAGSLLRALDLDALMDQGEP